jgi:hypothetical protein
MHGGQLVEELRVDKLQSWLKEFCSNGKGQDATQHQHRESEQQIQGSDVFVIGRKNPSAPTVRSTVVIIVVIYKRVIMWM